jgi:4-hydroxy-3-methylbut-2-enyl diphosphate reductase
MVEGELVSIVDFGAFVRLEQGVEGLIHISQFGPKPVNRAEDIVSIGQRVWVEVLRIEPEERKMSLALRSVETPATEEGEEAPPPETGEENVFPPPEA